MIAVRLGDDIEERLALLAKQTGRTKSFYVRKALTHYLDDMEDLLLATDRIKKPGPRVSHEEVERFVDLDD